MYEIKLDVQWMMINGEPSLDIVDYDENNYFLLDQVAFSGRYNGEYHEDIEWDKTLYTDFENLVITKFTENYHDRIEDGLYQAAQEYRKGGNDDFDGSGYQSANDNTTNTLYGKSGPDINDMVNEEALEETSTADSVGGQYSSKYFLDPNNLKGRKPMWPGGSIIEPNSNKHDYGVKSFKVKKGSLGETYLTKLVNEDVSSITDDNIISAIKDKKISKLAHFYNKGDEATKKTILSKSKELVDEVFANRIKVAAKASLTENNDIYIKRENVMKVTKKEILESIDLKNDKSKESFLNGLLNDEPELKKEEKLPEMVKDEAIEEDELDWKEKSKINQSEYLYYVVQIKEPYPAKITEGFEIKEDAIERAREIAREQDIKKDDTLKVLSKLGCKKYDLDPDNDKDWADPKWFGINDVPKEEIGESYSLEDQEGEFKDEFENDSNDELIDFKIPYWAASALVNDDRTGLSDDDEVELNHFIQDLISDYGNANLMLPSDDKLELGFLPVNSINAMGSDCIKMHLKPTKESDTIDMSETTGAMGSSGAFSGKLKEDNFSPENTGEVMHSNESMSIDEMYSKYMTNELDDNQCFEMYSKMAMEGSYPNEECQKLAESLFEDGMLNEDGSINETNVYGEDEDEDEEITLAEYIHEGVYQTFYGEKSSRPNLYLAFKSTSAIKFILKRVEYSEGTWGPSVSLDFRNEFHRMDGNKEITFTYNIKEDRYRPYSDDLDYDMISNFVIDKTFAEYLIKAANNIRKIYFNNNPNTKASTTKMLTKVSINRDFDVSNLDPTYDDGTREFFDGTIGGKPMKSGIDETVYAGDDSVNSMTQDPNFQKLDGDAKNSVQNDLKTGEVVSLGEEIHEEPKGETKMLAPEKDYTWDDKSGDFQMTELEMAPKNIGDIGVDDVPLEGQTIDSELLEFFNHKGMITQGIVSKLAYKYDLSTSEVMDIAYDIIADNDTTPLQEGISLPSHVKANLNKIHKENASNEKEDRKDLTKKIKSTEPEGTQFVEPNADQEKPLDEIAATKFDNKTSTDEVNSTISKGMEDLDYDVDPSDKFKDRLDKGMNPVIKSDKVKDQFGHVTKADNYANVSNSGLGDEMIKNADAKKKVRGDMPLYNKEQQPTTTKKVSVNESDDLSEIVRQGDDYIITRGELNEINEEVEKMKRLFSYNSSKQVNIKANRKVKTKFFNR